MAKRVLVLAGTQRGLFILESDGDRTQWHLRGPLANPAWAFGYISFDPAERIIYAGGHNAWFGAAVWVSRDLGETWTLSSEGMTYGDAGPAVKQVWNLTPVGGRVLAGVDPAGLFVSGDHGANWAPIGGPLAREGWSSGKAGSPVHSLICEGDQLWAAAAWGGVLYSPDGGASWEARNVVLADGRPAMGAQRLLRCAGVLYQQNHQGVFRSDDGGLSWRNITANLPSPFGFALAVHPRDPETVYNFPMNNGAGGRSLPDDKLAVWRTRDGGTSWTRLSDGLPQTPAHAHVLRHGMAVDVMDPAGIYFGTSSGHIYGSSDEGESWLELVSTLPEIWAVATAVIDTP